ncbi:hypothetical protein ACP4OV_023222 [Aristida adscensionis]
MRRMAFSARFLPRQRNTSQFTTKRTYVTDDSYSNGAQLLLWRILTILIFTTMGPSVPRRMAFSTSQSGIKDGAIGALKSNEQEANSEALSTLKKGIEKESLVAEINERALLELEDSYEDECKGAR